MVILQSHRTQNMILRCYSNVSAILLRHTKSCLLCFFNNVYFPLLIHRITCIYCLPTKYGHFIISRYNYILLLLHISCVSVFTLVSYMNMHIHIVLCVVLRGYCLLTNYQNISVISLKPTCLPSQIVWAKVVHGFPKSKVFTKPSVCLFPTCHQTLLYLYQVSYVCVLRLVRFAYSTRRKEEVEDEQFRKWAFPIVKMDPVFNAGPPLPCLYMCTG